MDLCIKHHVPIASIRFSHVEWKQPQTVHALLIHTYGPIYCSPLATKVTDDHVKAANSTDKYTEETGIVTTGVPHKS